MALSFLALARTVQGDVIHYSTTMSGPNESPSNASLGVGTADVFYDTTLHTMHVMVSFSGLTGTTTASHIHAPTLMPDTGTAGIATVTPNFTGFPLGVTSGTYDHTYDMFAVGGFGTAYMAGNGGTFASAEAAFLSAMDNEKAYLNVHSSFVPSGEIRGFMHRVPDAASTAALLALGLAAMLGYARNQRRFA